MCCSHRCASRLSRRRGRVRNPARILSVPEAWSKARPAGAKAMAFHTLFAVAPEAPKRKHWGIDRHRCRAPAPTERRSSRPARIGGHRNESWIQ
jgi:hypothetical protein